MKKTTSLIILLFASFAYTGATGFKIERNGLHTLETTPILEKHSENWTVPITIRGTVTDKKGTALVGATILVKDTNTGTVTDIDGAYILDAPEEGILVVSYVGYTTREIALGGRNVIDIVLSEGVELENITIIGSRGRPRTDIERPVPIDVVSLRELESTNQQDIGQQLHYTVPSFNAQKFGINDLAPLIDPASLRGLGPDQTLLLVNGKRRHKVSFFSANNGVGKGQLGNDINAIPSLAIKRVEILRDGAAAQYGSDAIAGVVNMQLNNARSGGAVRMYSASSLSQPKYDDIGKNSDLDGENVYGDDFITDGQTFSTSVNFGLPWGDDGFINTTLSFNHSEPSDRSGTYSHSSGWYTADQLLKIGDTDNSGSIDNGETPVTTQELETARGIDRDRAILGTAENTNGSLFVNAGKPLGKNFDYYMFGGFSIKEVVGGVFTRTPSRTDRAVLDIFPNGYNPEVPSVLTDWQLTSGAKGDLGNDWTLDFSLGNSGNNLSLYARNTVNPSMGADSPTRFYTGGLKVMQTVFNADVAKRIGNFTLAFGSEYRTELFQQSQGQTESWRPGNLVIRDSLERDVGSSGREGFTDQSDGVWTRSNIGVYAEVEVDVSDAFLLGGAARYENYSDFGNGFSYKLNARYKFIDQLALRASVNRSFRAPALAQVHYSNFVNISFESDGSSSFEPFLPIRDPLAQNAFGFSKLTPETSFDIAAGITSQLTDELTLTVDYYNITINDRIMVIGGIDPTQYSQFANAGYDAINIFTNALETNTVGWDVVANYNKSFKKNNSLNMTLAMNFNETKVEKISLTDELVRGGGKIDNEDIVFLTQGTPKQKFIFTANYRIGFFEALIRGTYFGEVTDASEDADPDTGGIQGQVLSSKFLTDLSLTAHINDQFSITGGINNVFDVYPDMLFSPNVRGEVIYSRRVNQFGTQGRMFNISLNYTW